MAIDEAHVNKKIGLDGTGAARYDTGKPPISLIPPQVILELAKVYGFGTHKYAAHNWEKGMDWSRMYNSANRHIMAWWCGETFDKESGHYTLAHAIWNLTCLLYYEMYSVGRDDRTFITPASVMPETPVKPGTITSIRAAECPIDDMPGKSIAVGGGADAIDSDIDAIVDCVTDIFKFVFEDIRDAATNTAVEPTDAKSQGAKCSRERAHGVFKGGPNIKKNYRRCLLRRLSESATSTITLSC